MRKRGLLRTFESDSGVPCFCSLLLCFRSACLHWLIIHAALRTTTRTEHNEAGINTKPTTCYIGSSQPVRVRVGGLPMWKVLTTRSAHRMWTVSSRVHVHGGASRWSPTPLHGKGMWVHYALRKTNFQNKHIHANRTEATPTRWLNDAISMIRNATTQYA